MDGIQPSKRFSFVRRDVNTRNSHNESMPNIWNGTKRREKFEPGSVPSSGVPRLRHKT